MLWCEEVFADKRIFLMCLSVRSVTFCIGMEVRTTSDTRSIYCFVDRHMPWILEMNKATLSLVSSGHHRIQLFETSQMLLLRRNLCLSFFINIQLNTLHFTSLHFTQSTVYVILYTTCFGSFRTIRRETKARGSLQVNSYIRDCQTYVSFHKTCRGIKYRFCSTLMHLFM
jgi:hypothetical protein